MRLCLKKYADGRLRPHWFGVFQRNGKTRVVKLCRLVGTPPASLSVNDPGDEAYEASRQKASATLAEMVVQRQTEADQASLTEKIHELRYGTRVEAIPLADMAARWEKFPRKRRPSELHITNCRRVFARFQEFMAEHATDVKELGAVRADHVRAFMDSEETRGVSPRTWNVSLTLLKGLFRRLDQYADAWRGYLSKQPTKDEDSVHREPFTPEEIDAVLAAADSDPEIKQLIITAVCTAMRRGDVCRLRWREVDLQQGFIVVKTSKTGETVEIPIFPKLQEVLGRAQAGRSIAPKDFVFPVAAHLYTSNPDSLNHRLQVVLERAGFVDEKKLARIKAAQARHGGLAQLSTDELRERGLRSLAATPMTEKRRQRTQAIFTRYLDGQTVKQIAAELPTSAGSVSMSLAAVERLIGAAVVRRPSLPAILRSATMVDLSDDAPRKRRACLKGWHSFRTTWITLALSAGVPEMVVRRVTGHATADVVLKHYFRPGRAQFRATLAGALPKALTAGKTSDPIAKAVQIIRRLPPSCAHAKKRLLALLAPAMAVDVTPV